MSGAPGRTPYRRWVEKSIVVALNSANCIFTARNSSCGKVMFSQVSVCPPGEVYTPWQADLPVPRDGYCSGWYASYWNAFLLFKIPDQLFIDETLDKGSFNIILQQKQFFSLIFVAPQCKHKIGFLMNPSRGTSFSLSH